MTHKTAHGALRVWSDRWQAVLLAVAVAMLVVLVGLAFVSLARGG